VSTPSILFRQLQEKYPDAVIMIAVCHGRERVYLKDAELVYCSICGEPMKGDVFEPTASFGYQPLPTAPAPTIAEFDIPAIVERIKARRELADASISTLASELGIRADRLARFESGRVEDDDLPELLRALVWASEFDASVVDAYRKPSTVNAGKAEAVNG
jgi:DNA-binding XRE family transcriptional regulator